MPGRPSINFLVYILFAAMILASCTKSKKGDALSGVWVISMTERQVRGQTYEHAFTPFGFDFFSSDSVEIFCRPQDAMRFSSYKISHDTCRLFRSDKEGWWIFKFARNPDGLTIIQDKDTLVYHYVSLENFKFEDLKRIDIAIASWNEVMAVSFLQNGSMEIRKNGYNPDSSMNYRVDKIYFLINTDPPFQKLSHNFQKLNFIAASAQGRQLLDSLHEYNLCSDAESNSILLAGDSLKELDYQSCAFDYSLFQYNKYILARSFGQRWDPTDKVISYDSMADDPIVFCGHVRWGKEHEHQLTLSEQVLLSSGLSKGKKISKEDIPPLSIPMYNDCSSDKYSRKIMTDGRVFKIATAKGEYYVDIGYDFFETVVNEIDRRRYPPIQ